eukprot:8646945-Ditylum_brightwellii.AAC.1
MRAPRPPWIVPRYDYNDFDKILSEDDVESMNIPSRPERPSGTLQNRTFDWFLAMILPVVGDTQY